ncbi:MAG TPA: kelch repeat-containing protein, partial [Candidatus Kapabacteria bacterium]|nr:kelch repeat-containing protein [Candidatus Kapabacteria bacterium]
MKIKVTLFVVACLFCMQGNVLAQWTPIARFPGYPNVVTDGCESFVINDTAYVASGHSSSFEQFNPANRSWIAKANIGSGRKWGGISFAVNGKGYVGSGDTTGGAGQCRADFWQYDPATNAWTRKADFAGGARDGVISFAIGDTGYAGGGIFGQTIPAQQDFWKYDASKDQWIQIGNLPMGPNWFAATFVINNKAYVATGAPDGSSGTNQMWEYDPATGNWTQKANFPATGRNSAVGFAVNGKGYVVGGMINYATTFTDVWSYDPVQDQWTQMADAYPDTLCAWMNGFVVGNTAYVGAGTGFTSTSLVGDNAYYAYDFNPVAQVKPDIYPLGLGVYSVFDQYAIDTNGSRTNKSPYRYSQTIIDTSAIFANLPAAHQTDTISGSSAATEYFRNPGGVDVRQYADSAFYQNIFGGLLSPSPKWIDLFNGTYGMDSSYHVFDL